ncbi:cytochrome P450 [Mycobacterium montefiorense]|uniref:Cytochrome P450 n=1 Tax=Mycobacterium montefiorense TaxID=154654 RepID=A0AA37PID8_9MYCO|nr:cytochrome P450 [Mycobacterium montefiorense]GBG37275.1 cytochrome P450 [Mycobacterium montefiorense]GKU35775.1 cytochrome P450 [Mycobacterium montefiorense]GKU39739.1 cytochrome P450 [Mycobacterium montefiorense]GKU47614.1 cytochrome P450 [Mycobacterium montefiorense]GKU48921.1 cytochrome P450 [Mycobacterium montefiorense]
MTATAAGDVDLANPDTFVNGVPHDALTQLRRTDPVHWQPMAGEPGFWAVLRHADAAHVARHPEIFSSSEGGFVLEDLPPEQLAMMRNMLSAMDPPVHTVHRAALLPHFRARVMAGIEDQVRQICRTVMAEARELREVEFVHDVAAPLPSKVIGELFGLPPEDWDYIHALAGRITSNQEPEFVGAEGDARAATIEMAMYGIGLAAVRRQNDRTDDLASVILHTDFGGQPMSDIDFGSFFLQLIIAGNDTTKGMLSSGLLSLVRHPKQLAELRADPSLIPGAVEEIIRYDNPFHCFRRTALSDTELSGTRIAAGDKVAMYYSSANRDEEVFDDPQAFDIHRSPNPHLSFGIAGHFCLGVHLARLEGRVFFEELLDAFRTIDLNGEPVRTRSNLTNMLRLLPVRLTA